MEMTNVFAKKEHDKSDQDLPKTGTVTSDELKRFLLEAALEITSWEKNQTIMILPQMQTLIIQK